MKFIEPSFEILSEDFTRDIVLDRIERAARTCYKSEDRICEGSDAKMVRNLIRRDHEAMLEHAPNLSVRFICDRGVTHELVRHRLFSFAQESTRYVNYRNDGVQFIIPEWIIGNDRNYLLSSDMNCMTDLEELLSNPGVMCFVDSCTHAESTYHCLIEAGWKPQQARAVLPNCTKTEIVVTGNVREWRNCFKLRTEQAAHPQMCEIMIPLILKLNEDIPELWGDIVTKNSLTDWKPMYKL